MKILHTSDWHLGRQLYNQKRTDEFEAFLNWLIETIEQQQIDTLLIAGDVFDTTTPSASTQEMYYHFLYRASNTCCSNIVIIGGNHDSALLLNAPKHLLKAMHIHVVGEMSDDLSDELITLYDKNKQAQAIICAVPFLRDRDVRTVQAYEELADKATKLVEGISAHYDEMARLAQARIEEVGQVPVIAMGHLFTTADRSTSGDGVRELYVGTLAHIGGERFSKVFDYVALGHLHIAQTVGGEEHKRYSGSPIPMGFNEANQTKKIVIVEFTNGKRSINELEIPRFKALYRIEGAADEIVAKIQSLLDEKCSGWIEVTITKGDHAPNLSTQLIDMLDGSPMLLLSTKDARAREYVHLETATSVKLEELSPADVFEKCLNVHAVSDELKSTLKACFDELVMQYNEKE